MNYYVFDVANRLREAGETVALVHGREPKSTFRGTGYIFDHLRAMTAPVDQVRTRLEAIVDDFQPDVIQIHGMPNLALDDWLASRAPTTRWIHNHQFYCSGQAMTWARPRHACERPHGLGCLLAHGIHGCGSSNLLKNVIRYRQTGAALDLLRQSCHLQVASEVLARNLARNGIEPSRIEHIPLYAPPASDKKPPMPTRRIVLQPSALVRHKGVWLMVRNIDQLPDDVDLVLGGAGGELLEPLEEYVANNQLGHRVRVMGEVPPSQWSVLFHQATLVAIPSLWNEPLGLTGLYAMSYGKPVIAFRSGGIDEWLEDGKTGIGVRFGARNAFVESTAKLLNDWQHLKELGIQARKAWDARFRPEAHVEKLQAYYKRIAGIR